MNTADVVVIGAGIVGAAVAHRAATRGLRVALLERDEPGRQGSGSTAGNIHIQAIHTRRPGQQVPVDVRRFLPLQRAARERWEAWESEIGPVGFRRCGGLMVAETARQLEDLHRKHLWEREIGIATEVLDAEQAGSVLPLLSSSVLGATWCEWDGFADPALVTPALVRCAVVAGAALHVNTPVHAVRRAAVGWIVEAGEETWSAPTVVNAAGPWIRDISGLAGAPVDMAPTAIQMHTLSAGDVTLPYVVAHVGEGLSVKQTDDGQIMVGGGWPAGPMRPDGRAEVERASIEGNLGQVRRILPAVGARPLDRVWTGPLAACADEMPVVGEVSGMPGLYIVGGTYSFTLAPLWGDLVADLITGITPGLPIGDLGPDRLLAGPAGQDELG